MSKQQGDWWARIREGLVRDPDAPHYRRMGNALWVYLNLHMGADLETGQLFRTYQTISDETGIPEPTIRKMMKKLEAGKYIQTVRLARGLHIQILKWEPVKKKKRVSIPGQSKTGVIVQKSKSDRPKKNIVSISGQSLSNGNDESKPPRVSTSGRSNETLNETQKREVPFSLSKSSKKKTKAAQKTNPDIKVAVNHYSREFFRIQGEKPRINGAHGAIYKQLLEGDEEKGNPPMPILEIKELTTSYLSQQDAKLREKGFPVEWLPAHITGLKLQKKPLEREFVH